MTEISRYFHFPTPNGINNTLRTSGKASLTAKHNYVHIAVPRNCEHVVIPQLEENELNNKQSYIKPFTYASAFAGIGGMTMGMGSLGGKGVIAWEYDPTEKRRQYAQDAHKLLHPNVPIQGDICEVDTDELPDFDLFCFTPPCQSFSVAGKRGGFEDTRGTLTFEALRIAKDKKPKVLFMENVKGLVNHDKGNTMSTIFHAINEIGYTLDFTVLNSKFFDVAQNRERVYLIAVRDDLIEPEPWDDVKGTTMLHKAKRRLKEEGARTFNFDWPEQSEVRTRLRDFLEQEVDARFYIDEEKTSRLVAQLEHKERQSDGLPIREATEKGYSIATEGDTVNMQFLTSTTRRGRVGNQIANMIEASGFNQGVVELENSPIMLGLSDISGHDILRRVYSPQGQCPTITAGGGGNQEPKIAEEVRPVLTPERIEKRQNGPRFKVNGAEAHTITTQDRHGVAVGEYPKYRIRKLTPRECLRLQAIPEHMIDQLEPEFSASRLYKFAGNGLTINVVTAIGERLLKYL